MLCYISTLTFTSVCQLIHDNLYVYSGIQVHYIQSVLFMVYILCFQQGELEVEHDEIVLSMQQAEELLLEDSHHLDRYLVYAHLSRTGCKVLYHQPHLIFTSAFVYFGVM